MSEVQVTMRAAFIRRHGSADEIEVGNLPVPTPGPTDVLVHNTAMAVNHVDTFVRSGAYRTHTPFPFIVGRDLVGTVVQIGADVQGFATGGAVWCNSVGHDGRQGSFAEYAVVASDRLYQLPLGVDPHEAVSVFHTAATAHLGLFREARLRPGQTVFVAGAAGGVGSAAVQMSSAVGARVIATAATADVAWCRSNGAQEVFDYNDPHLSPKLAATAPEGVDVWWDNTGRHNFDTALSLLTRGGRIIVVAGLGARPELPVDALYTNDISLHGFAISNASTGDLAEAAATINQLLSQRRLHGRIGARLPLRHAADAHRQMESHTVRGRIVVIP